MTEALPIAKNPEYESNTGNSVGWYRCLVVWQSLRGFARHATPAAWKLQVMQ
jgi:hypothetical protein